MSSALNEAPWAASCANPDFVEESDRRILIVDDEDQVRRFFANVLSESYLCTTAANAEEAFAYLVKEPFALVISDMIMPGLNGVEFIRKTIAHFPDTAVIMVSGVDRRQRVLDVMRLGAFDYLVKPCGPAQLQNAVERALERRALLRDARRYKQDLERRNVELAHQKAELERLQAQIVHSEKMASLGQLAAGVAHELNNPVGFIYGNMEMLSECADRLERPQGDASPLSSKDAQLKAIEKELDYQLALKDLRSILSDCKDGATRVRDIVQNLRTFSRLDEAEFKKVDLHEGLDSTIRLLSRYYTSNHIRLRRDYAELPLVNCYAGQLNQVWMNLLVNAAQAVDETGGEVHIRTQLENQQVVVTVGDSGPGIAAEHLTRIFDPFFTTKPVGEGTGLGLSISYGIIKRHGGSISVDSQLGQGTTFTVVIPIDAKPQSPDDAQ